MSKRKSPVSSVKSPPQFRKSSATGPRAQKNQDAKHARTARPLPLGRRSRRRDFPAGRKARYYEPVLSSQAGAEKHALPLLLPGRATLHQARAKHPGPSRTWPRARRFRANDLFLKRTCPREPDPHGSPPPAGYKRGRCKRLRSHVHGKRAVGGGVRAPALVFHRCQARTAGFGGIYLAFFSPRVRVRHLGEQGPKEGRRGGSGENSANRIPR